MSISLQFDDFFQKIFPKNSSKFVYIIAKLRRSPFNLTIFFYKKNYKKKSWKFAYISSSSADLPSIWRFFFRFWRFSLKVSIWRFFCHKNKIKLKILISQVFEICTKSFNLTNFYVNLSKFWFCWNLRFSRFSLTISIWRIFLQKKT